MQRKANRSIYIKLIIVMLVCLTACADENCVTVYNNELLVQFFDEDGDAPKRVRFYSITAANTDSVFFDATTFESTYRLPVNPAADTTRFILVPIDTILLDTLSRDPLLVRRDTVLGATRTIGVSYSRSTRIITPECGVEIAYQNLMIDTISYENYLLSADDLSRFNDANIEIYE